MNEPQDSRSKMMEGFQSFANAVRAECGHKSYFKHKVSGRCIDCHMVYLKEVEKRIDKLKT